ncbi:MAG: flagellar regulator YcgR PilZN domain-containing protein [Ketobacteraceae bacterium]|nr:flagellar regulator YcgR PilZN domain-containing protein [Ketobacteraceae bacterium]
MRIPFFSKLFEKETEATRPKPGAPRSVHHNPRDIANFLKKYAEANSLIEGEINGGTKSPVTFTTGINSIDPDQRLIHFDAFQPEDINTDIPPGTSVHFSLSHLGVRTQFDCVLKQSLDLPRYEHIFEFPKAIEHIQLRDAFRIKISSVNPVRITLESNDRQTYSGLVSDLSVTGARMHLQGLIQPQPHRGDDYPNCYVTLSDGARIVCGARLMHWTYDPRKDTTVLGIKFVDMEQTLERKLNRFLTDLQRKERSAGIL